MMKNEKVKQIDSDCVAGEELMQAYLEVILKDHPDLITKIIIKAFSPKDNESRNKNKHLEQLQNPVLLDDNADNVEAAQAAGYQAILVNNQVEGKKLSDHLDILMKQPQQIDVAVLAKSIEKSLSQQRLVTPTSSPEHSRLLNCSDEWRKTSQGSEEDGLIITPMVTCSSKFL